MRALEADLSHPPDVAKDGHPRVFREVNEHIRALTAAAAGKARREFICECDNPECLDFVPLTLAEYDAIRATDRAVLASRHGDRGAAAPSRRFISSTAAAGARGR